MSAAERGAPERGAPERGAAGGPSAAPCGCGGGGERDAVRALRRLSERAGPEQPRAAAPGDAWAEAVRGWGGTAPLACFQLQKQGRKAKGSDAGDSCLICAEMLQPLDKAVGQDVRTKRNPLKHDGKLAADAAAASALEREAIATRSSRFDCYPTAGRIKTEIPAGTLHSAPASPGEKTALPIKQHCVWNLRDVKNPEGVREKEIKPQGLHAASADRPGSWTSKSSLLFPPVRDATASDSADPSRKNKATVTSRERLKGTSGDAAPCKRDAEAVEHKAVKGTDQMKENTEIHEQSSFVPSHAKVSLLQEDPEQPPWPCALVANKTTATMSNPIALEKNSHHSCKRLPRSKEIQHTKNYDIQGSLTNVRNRCAENKQEKKAKNQAVPPLSGLLPSLTVSRAARTTLPSRLT